MQVLSSWQGQGNHQALQMWIYRECPVPASAISSIHSSPIPQLSTSSETCTYSVYSAFFDRTNTPDKNSTPSTLSAQAIFCQNPKILAVIFPPGGLLKVCSPQTCILGYWNLELQLFCNRPITSSTLTDVPCAGTAVALKSSHLHITCRCWLRRWEKPVPKSKYKLSMLFSTSQNVKGI